MTVKRENFSKTMKYIKNYQNVDKTILYGKRKYKKVLFYNT